MTTELNCAERVVRGTLGPSHHVDTGQLCPVDHSVPCAKAVSGCLRVSEALAQ